MNPELYAYHIPFSTNTQEEGRRKDGDHLGWRGNAIQPRCDDILRMTPAGLIQKSCLCFDTTAKCSFYGVEDAIKPVRNTLQESLCHTLS